jgi:PPOX class probable F420-dependent enzyme
MGFRLTDDEAWAMLAEAHTGILTTLRRDGRPVALPVWHVVDSGAIHVRTPAASKKMRRVANDPRGSFLVESGLAWAELTSVTVPVDINVITDDDEAARIAAAIDAKYAAHRAPTEKLPAAVRSAYGDMRVLRMVPVGRFLSWNNAALLGPR